MPTDQPLPPPSPEPSSSTRPRGMVLCGIVALSGLIAYQGPSLWDEVLSLRQDLSASDTNAVIGYVGISPKPSAALPPGDWFQVEDQQAKLWGGWHPEQGHRWFHIQRDDLDRRQLSESIGRDLYQGINEPLSEVCGGPISERIPGHHEVEAMLLDGHPCAYPVLVLGKVLVVNDEVGGKPLLVVFSGLSGQGSSVFESTLDGHRLRMGFSGYIYKERPLLYDRSSEGLWLEEDEGLVALSGPNRGHVLKRLGRMHRVRWDDWSHRHHDGRVLIGADRTHESTSL